MKLHPVTKRRVEGLGQPHLVSHTIMMILTRSVESVPLHPHEAHGDYSIPMARSIKYDHDAWRLRQRKDLAGAL